MAYSTLPTIPLIVFAVIEPALFLLVIDLHITNCLCSRVWAWIVCNQDPFNYYATQVPNHTLNEQDHFPGQALALSLQMGNVLLLLAAMAVICCFSSSPSTAKWYLVAVAFADYGHIYGAARGVGPDVFWDPSQWNDMVWGGVAGSAILNLFRWLTVLGVFGPIGGNAALQTKSGKKHA
ncbi:hypothetical protein M406DRAFT_274188 [Cryphonectria parasitica EP155]|uniref:DUF7704 domain-containing protein n=1 Tax=Cryphonectria parasitica (strain ATCC 38755 / EP155) TaxID=660469 RepID=A0A9P4Y593_CRYP1|nr:uncharacterized protein M406DRAFT_274188 [Cryphonectria parasitica EP155]KAF3766778.1 hypothetical protein M406DRAFT_274188 [Cryphonectria parasitica EP155]